MTSAKPSRLDEALDALDDGDGTVSIDHQNGHAEVDVVEADRIGVRVREIRIERDRPIDVAGEANALPERMRSLPERVEPVEVAPELGGAVLRSEPHEERYFEVAVEPTRTGIRRTRVDDEGTRHEEDWTMTRDQLDRLIHEAAGPLQADEE